MSDISERLRNIDGFGWRCGEPLKDKGSHFKCGCGCSVPADDCDEGFSIVKPQILNEAAHEIDRLRHRCNMEVAHITELKEQIKTLRAERDRARAEVCRLMAEIEPNTTAEQHADDRGWDCFTEYGHAGT